MKWNLLLYYVTLCDIAVTVSVHVICFFFSLGQIPLIKIHFCILFLCIFMIE